MYNLLITIITIIKHRKIPFKSLANRFTSMSINSESIYFHNVVCHTFIQLFTMCTKSHNCLLSRRDFLVNCNMFDSGCGISNKTA